MVRSLADRTFQLRLGRRGGGLDAADAGPGPGGHDDGPVQAPDRPAAQGPSAWGLMISDSKEVEKADSDRVCHGYEEKMSLRPLR